MTELAAVLTGFAFMLPWASASEARRLRKMSSNSEAPAHSPPPGVMIGLVSASTIWASRARRLPTYGFRGALTALDAPSVIPRFDLWRLELAPAELLQADWNRARIMTTLDPFIVVEGALCVYSPQLITGYDDSTLEISYATSLGTEFKHATVGLPSEILIYVRRA